MPKKNVSGLIDSLKSDEKNLINSIIFQAELYFPILLMNQVMMEILLTVLQIHLLPLLVELSILSLSVVLRLIIRLGFLWIF